MLRGIRWRIAIPYVLLVLIILVFLVFYLSAFVRNVYLSNLEEQLTTEARLVGDTLGPSLATGTSLEELDPAAYRYARLLGARVTIIGADGTVLGESHRSRVGMENHLDRPEVQEALATGQGSSARESVSVGDEMLYVAVPVYREEEVLGIVRVALSLSEVDAQVRNLRQAIVFAGLVASALAAIVALVLAERTARPVRELTRVAERMAEGDLNARISIATDDELGQLARAFNHMADQLREQVTTLAAERSRLAGRSLPTVMGT